MEDLAPTEPAEDLAEHYAAVICDLVEDLFDRRAFGVLSLLLDDRAEEISGDLYVWPYARPMSEFCLADELIFLTSKDRSWIDERPAQALFAAHVEKILAEGFTDAEEAAVLIAFLRVESVGSHREAHLWAKKTIQRRVLELAADLDFDTLRETLAGFGFKSRGRFDPDIED